MTPSGRRRALAILAALLCLLSWRERSALAQVGSSVLLQLIQGQAGVAGGAGATSAATLRTVTASDDPLMTGATMLSYISAGATEDEHAVKASAGVLYSIAATNTNAAVRYLKCENDTAANTAPGTDTPEFRLAIPGATAGAGFVAQFPQGAAFSTALTCWLVTGAADSDVAEVAANEIIVFYTFK